MKEPEGCMAEAAREASALMGSAAAGGAGAAGSGRPGGGGKGGEGGPGGRAQASCSRRTWFCSCWSFSGSLGREQRQSEGLTQVGRAPGPRPNPVACRALLETPWHLGVGSHTRT